MAYEYYSHPRSDVIEFLSKKINKDVKYAYTLDIGCAAGEFSRNLKQTLLIDKFNWIGIEKETNLPNSQENYSILGNCIHDDLPDCLNKLEDNYFDCIFALDILEHLTNPDDVLIKLKSKIKSNGTLIVSIPNISHYSIIISLIKQKWIYADSGILDRTHLRFFTPQSFKSFANKNGWQIIVKQPINSYIGIKGQIFNLLRNTMPHYLINYLSFGHIYKLKCMSNE